MSETEINNLKEIFDEDTFIDIMESQNTIMPIEFDLENVIFLKGGKLTNGLMYLLYDCGGDWEEPPITVVAYNDKGLNKVFIPIKSNIYNLTTKEAYGNDNESDELDLIKRMKLIGITNECNPTVLCDEKEIIKEFDAFINKKQYQYKLTKERYSQLEKEYLEFIKAPSINNEKINKPTIKNDQYAVIADNSKNCLTCNNHIKWADPEVQDISFLVIPHYCKERKIALSFNNDDNEDETHIKKGKSCWIVKTS
jgi:hypothetical protein